MKLSTLLTDLIPSEATWSSQEVIGLCLSSVQVTPDKAFVALGEAYRYIPDAVERGAKVILTDTQRAVYDQTYPDVLIIMIPDLSQQLSVLCDRLYGPLPDFTYVGITGTNGKTTVSYLMAQCFARLSQRCGIIGTLGVGTVDNLQPSLLTTPDALTLHDYLNQLEKAPVDTVVMEVSSHSLVQGRVDRIPFESAIFSNLTQDHLDYHGDMTQYGQAKLKLFQFDSLKRVILNADDAFTQKILATLPDNMPVMLCSQKPKKQLVYPNRLSQVSSITVEDLELTAKGIVATILTPFGEGRLRSALVGAFNVSNLLLVIGELLMQNIALQDALHALSDVVAPPGRMQRVAGKAPQIIVDYAHTPDALERALAAVRAHTKGSLWCVFGCGGDRDQDKRPVMGESAARLADQIVLTNDNPRTEDPDVIIEAIKKGIPDTTTKSIHIETDRAKAIALAVSQAEPDDAILIAGKGHEDYQILGTKRFPFSDEACVRALLGDKT